MKKVILFFAAVALMVSCAPKPTVVWTEGEMNPETKRATQTITLVNAPEGTDWTLWFSSAIISPENIEESEGTIECYQGPSYKITPTSRSGKDLIVKYLEKPFKQEAEAPDGFILECNGKVIPLKTTYEFLPSERVPDFEYTHVEPQVWDMVPALKNVEPKEGTTVVAEYPEPVFVQDAPKAGWYRITLDGACKVEAADEDGAQYAKVTLDNLKRNVGGENLPNMVIEDWPDFAHRGYMLDISRSFANKNQLLKMIDLLAHYKLSVFHIHFSDDEGWRLAIEKFPELTSYGAQHAFPVKKEDGSFVEENALGMSYGGFDTEVVNGHISKEDYIEILRYAWERRIKIIPEFDMPAHAYAMIKSMEKYAERTGDTSYLLSEPEDQSDYRSVQRFTHNAINVALPSTYNFIEVIFDQVIAYHNEAGVPLPAIHVGGDEVPHGAWEKSPACMKLMEENGWTNLRMLKSYFLNKVLDIAEPRGVKIAGWQEMVTDIDPVVCERVRKSLLSTNIWSVRGKKDQLAYEFANDGLPVVLSNSPSTYLDLAYKCDRQERGRSWSGYIDERRTYSFLPYDIYRSVRWDDEGNMRDIENAPEGKVELKAKENIIGVQAQLWGESLRNFDHITYYTFPKVCGIFERAWNASPAWEGTTKSDDPLFMEQFNAWYSTVVDHEFPYFEEVGINYRKR